MSKIHYLKFKYRKQDLASKLLLVIFVTNYYWQYLLRIIIGNSCRLELSRTSTINFSIIFLHLIIFLHHVIIFLLPNQRYRYFLRVYSYMRRNVYYFRVIYINRGTDIIADGNLLFADDVTLAPCIFAAPLSHFFS